MRVESTLSQYQRGQLVELFEQGYGYAATSSRLKLDSGPVKSFYNRWRLHGRLCLMNKPTKTQYSFETKKEIVERFLAGERAMDLAAEFHLSSKNLIRTWVRNWRNGGDEAITPKPKGRPKGSTPKPPLSEEDTLRLENKRLLAKVAYLEKIRDLRAQGHR